MVSIYRVKTVVFAALALCAAGVLSSSHAFAQNFIAVSPNNYVRPDPPNTSAGVIPQTSGLYDMKYRQCRSSSDCVAFNPGCHAPVAINRSSVTAFSAYRDSMTRYETCGFVGNITQGMPQCVGGVCAMQPVRAVLDQPDSPDFCTSDSECLVVQDSCGKKIAVNQRHAGLGAARASQTCAEPEDKRPVSQLSCQHNRCTVVLDNYAGQ